MKKKSKKIGKKQQLIANKIAKSKNTKGDIVKSDNSKIDSCKKKVVSSNKIIKLQKSYLKNPLAWIVSILLLFLLFQSFHILKLTNTINTLHDSNGVLIDDMSNTTNFISDFGSDLNEIKRYLLLPTKNYTYTNVVDEEIPSEAIEKDSIVDLFKFIDKLGGSELNNKRFIENQTLLKDYFAEQNTLNLFAKNNLTFVDGMQYHLVNNNYTHLISIDLKKDGQFILKSYTHDIDIEDDFNFDSFKDSLQNFIKNDLAKLKELLLVVDKNRGLLSSIFSKNAEVLEVLTNQNLSISEEYEIDKKFFYKLTDNDGVELSTITISKLTGEVTFDDDLVIFENEEDLVTIILELLEQFNVQDEILMKIEEAKKSITLLKDDKGFTAQLKKAGLDFSFESIDTDTAIEYQIFNLDRELLMILYIDKKTGEFMVRDPDNTIGQLLTSAITVEQDVMELPEYLDIQDELHITDNEVNILVAGKHGSLTDTLIFMNIDIANQKITLISIPRDLYYNNRKINAVYSAFGMDELTRQLSNILGYKIDKYILIDMYVFVDLINLVDGVDIKLEEDLIDPTYRTYENGYSSTLYYPAGEHHFNGVEALRIARSRHTTSDYSRAARQQLIIEGLKNKAKNLGFGDAKAVIGIMKTLLEQTETNISFEDAMKYYFSFQSFSIDRGHVISTGNVLETKLIPVSIPTAMKTEVCETIDGEESCKMQSAMYTSQPRDGNWGYIKWWVANILKN